MYAGAGGGVYAGAGGVERGFHGTPHSSSPSAPIDSRHAASLHEYSSDRVVGAGATVVVTAGGVVVELGASVLCGTSGTTGTVVEVVVGRVVMVDGATEDVVVVGGGVDSASSFSVAAPMAPMPMNAANTPPTIHGHFGFFVPC